MATGTAITAHETGEIEWANGWREVADTALALCNGSPDPIPRGDST